MTIKDECYNLAKILWPLEITKQIRKLVLELNKSIKETDGSPQSISSFGHIASQQNAQFMGYLITDYKRHDINKMGFLKVPNITEEERDLLKKAHYIIQYLNKSLVSSVINKAPNLAATLDPYSQYPYPPYQLDIQDILNPDIFNELISAVNECQSVYNILHTPDSIKSSLDSIKILDSSLQLINKIEKYGVHNAPKELLEIKLSMKNGSSEYSAINFLFSLISLRAILSNIDQIIFQALLTDKLTVLNETNIINISKENTHSIGTGLTLFVQPKGEELLTSPGELILVKLENSNFKMNKLGLVKGTVLNFSRDFGNTKEFRLRIVDNQLKPYFGLLI